MPDPKKESMFDKKKREELARQKAITEARKKQAAKKQSGDMGGY
jgi:vancomycin permeability regulator SanA